MTKNIFTVVNFNFASKLLLALFIFASFFPFRHVLNFSSASKLGWYAEPLAISIYLADIFFVFFLIACWRNFRRLQIDSAVIFVVVFVFFLAQAFRNSDPLLGIYSLIRLFQFFALVYLVTRQLNVNNIRKRIAILLLIFGVVQSLLAIYQVSTGQSLGLRYLGEQSISINASGIAKVDLGDSERILRAYGTMPHPNILGGYLVLSLTSSIFLFRAMPGRRRLIAFTVILLTIGLFLTFSRSAYLAALLLFLFALLRFRRSISRVTIKCSLVIIVTALVLITIISPLRTAFIYRVIPPSADLFISDRFVLASNGARIFAKHPLIGTGLGNYLYHLIELAPPGSGLQNWQYDYPHNALAELLAELGIYGVIIYLYLFWKLISKHLFSHNVLLFSLVIIAPLIFLDHYLWTNQIGRILFIMFILFLPAIFATNESGKQT